MVLGFSQMWNNSSSTTSSSSSSSSSTTSSLDEQEMDEGEFEENSGMNYDEPMPEARNRTCAVCTFDNFASSKRCSMCRSDLDSQAGVTSSSNVICERCAFQNGPGALACSACGNELTVNELRPEACSACTLINEKNAKVCACCGQKLVTCSSTSEPAPASESGTSSSASPMVEDQPEEFVCAACNGSFSSSQVGYYPLDRCKHSFCRRCIVDWVGKSIAELNSGDQIFCGISCPAYGCGRTLSRQDIRAVGGHCVMSFLDTRAITSLEALGDKLGLETMGDKLSSIVDEVGTSSVYAAVRALGAAYRACMEAKRGPEESLHAKKRTRVGGKKEEEQGSKSESESKSDIMDVMDETLLVAVNKLAGEIGGNYRNGESLPYLVTVLMCVDPEVRMVLVWFLRNDSALDIAGRSKLYFEFFSLLAMLVSRSEIFPLLCTEKPCNDCWDVAADAAADQQQHGSLINLFEKLHKQASFIMKTSVSVDDDEKAAVEVVVVAQAKHTFEELRDGIKSWQTAVARCSWFKDADEFFKERWPLIHKAAKAAARRNFSGLTSTQLRAQEEEDYVAALKPHQFKEALLMESHYFRERINWQGLPSRTRRICKEIAGLATNLPLNYGSSIHIRVDERRTDILKALIIGPSGTPYQDGIFLFDILLNQNYPDEPPVAQFLTTGGGKVRFNPNLYECGKICLSLLGTWAGPSWSSSSTLLQVLVSLQSLVFVEEPYYNEPGYVKSERSMPLSEDYNQKQRFNTLKYSMLPALLSPDAAFKEVIEAHFRLKKQVIQETAEEWCKSFYAWKKGKNVSFDMDSAAAKVKKQLNLKDKVGFMDSAAAKVKRVFN